jgi:hypothetical protein
MTIPYYDHKTIAQILAEFELERINEKLSIDQILKFLSIYKNLLKNLGKKVVLIAD